MKVRCVKVNLHKQLKIIMLHEILRKLDVYCVKKHYMPRSIDWLWDLKRLKVNGTRLVIFDVGANIGQTTEKCLQEFPMATVHSFEPTRGAFDVLFKKFGAIDNVKCNHLAISDSCGSASILVLPYSQMSHLVAESTISGESGSRLEEIQTISIDTYCAKHGVNHIDILKTDTEGHDLPVLKGAGKTLKSGRIDWILVEVTFDSSDSTHSNFDTINNFLKMHGMELYCFYDHYFTEEKLHHLFCNALFVRRGISVSE